MPSSARRINLAALLLILALTPTAVAADEGDLCDLPTFDFPWPDSVNPNLAVELKKTGKLVIRIVGRDSQGHDITVKIPPRIYHPGENRVRVDLTKLDLYLSNTVTIRYKGVPSAPGKTVCAERRKWKEVAEVVVFERQLLKFDLGTVFSRNKNDGFDSAPEISVSAISRWKPRFTGGVDFRISELAQLDGSQEDGEMATEPPPADTMNGTEGDEGTEETKEPDVFNPFTDSGSILRGNFYLVWHPKPKNRAKPGQQLYPPPFGIVGGVGFSSYSGDSDSVETRQRLYYGVRMQVQGYNRKRTPGKFGGTTGFVQLGWADDDLWKYQTLEDHDGDPETDKIAVDQDERDRYFVEAALEFPNLGGEKGRLALRFFADLPQSGNGPSDVRFSVLAAIDLKALGKAIGTGG